MKPPVDPTNCPFIEKFSWFRGEGFSSIIRNSDANFKQQLKQNVLKLVIKLNRLFQDKIDAWQYVEIYKDCFPIFFKACIRLGLSDSSEFELLISERLQLLTFFNYAFNSIEVDFVHDQIRRYLPLSIWINLSESRRNHELSKLTKRIQIAWAKLEEQDKKLEPIVLDERMFERKFMFEYMKQFLRILQSAVVQSSEAEDDEEMNSEDGKSDEINKDITLYCQRFLEFMIDIESQLPLRRFFHALLEYSHFLVRCQQSDLARHVSPDGHLFNQLVELLLLYTKYEIDIMSGESLSDEEIMRQHEVKIWKLQKILWSKYPNLRNFATKPVRMIANPSTLYRIITSFDNKQELFDFMKTIGLVDDLSLDEDDRENAPLMASILMNYYRKYETQMKKINSIPLFPNESVIWDTNLVPDQYYNYEFPLALPKLNLQYLTMSDYLLRNFMLFKNESTYEIRQDIEDGIIRSKCRWTTEGKFATGPKQRMALIIKDFSILDVGKPRLGENCPSRVRAKVLINMDYVRPEWRKEWEQLRKHDTCFLVSFRKTQEKDTLGWPDGTFPAKHLIKYVRGCEIEGLLDSEGKIVDEFVSQPTFKDNLRTFIVWLDCNQYQIDQDSYEEQKTNVYQKFHLMVRRKPEKNNFKGVLETIRNLINTKFVVPFWLRNLIIGFGDPTEALPDNLRVSNGTYELDYFDTFLNHEHLKETIGNLKPDFVFEYSENDTTKLVPPFKVIFDETHKKATVIPYTLPLRGPYVTVVPKKNAIRFTTAQVKAITSGLQHGLTMVVGPPGTGKTDVAVQILSALYHSNPKERTLIVTHSNQALNQIFGKMIDLDVNEHHLLRLGHGEEDLESDRDFSRQGRIRQILSKRTELLNRATDLAKSLDLEFGQKMTCESAEYFRLYHIESRWNDYLKSLDNNSNDIGEKFPFKRFFEDAPQPIFKGKSFEEDMEIASGCYLFISQIFEQLRSFRPFEIFTNASDRIQYLLIKEAKIIAMTCTHAGLKRKELVELGFQYDNILMEETAQILEIETTIPLLLQNPENGVNRLKRWIMIGDHHQLPPIIQNSAFQKFSNMEQSLFARFVRLGVPYIELDAQGRARPSICDLYRWRYKQLEELSLIKEDSQYKLANAGFVYDYQMINVDDYKGVGESSPMPYYYQNLGEAEYVILLYKYMRLIGYPKEKITILTTYNGQKSLIKELMDKAFNEQGSKVTTVDKFQGQQNDFILLSLVRTKTIGHIKDIRRLVVAMSRARLGLYVLGRVNLFRSSIELQYSMKQFQSRPLDLCLFTQETSYPTDRLLEQPINLNETPVKIIKSIEEMQQFVYQINKQLDPGNYIPSSSSSDGEN